jgi:GDP-D-mannose dehydratase
MKRALITGITGQDGSWDPHNRGVKLFLHYGDLADGTNLRRVLEAAQPDELYNLAAQSHVKVSFEEAGYTADNIGEVPFEAGQFPVNR